LIRLIVLSYYIIISLFALIFCNPTTLHDDDDCQPGEDASRTGEHIIGEKSSRLSTRFYDSNRTKQRQLAALDEAVAAHSVVDYMYSEYTLAASNAHSPAPDVGIREINTQNNNLPYIRQGLNGPAIFTIPNHPHMAQHAHHQPPKQSQNKDKDKDRINVLATPSSTVINGQLIIGDANSSLSPHFLLFFVR